MLDNKRFLWGREGPLQALNSVYINYSVAALISYLHVVLTNLPTTVGAGKGPVYTVIFSVSLEMSFFHGFTTSCTLCVTILADFLVCLLIRIKLSS